jgi:hypothetical protein
MCLRWEGVLRLGLFCAGGMERCECLAVVRMHVAVLQYAVRAADLYDQSA